MSNNPTVQYPFIWLDPDSPPPDTAKTPMLPPPPECKPCECSWWTSYTKKAHECSKCAGVYTTKPFDIGAWGTKVPAQWQKVIDVLESAGIELANSGSVELSKELFDAMDFVRKHWK